MTKIIYFDICAIPLFLMILFVCYSRKMTKGSTNQLFISVVLLSLFSAITDLGIEIPSAYPPLSDAGLAICTLSTYIYLALRNATNAVLLLFLLHLTQTSFLIRNKLVKVIYCIPYAAIIVMLAQNVFTHSAFTVTREVGYARGPLMNAFYGVAFIYGIVGFIYCIYCRRYMPVTKWVALLSIYVVGHTAVVVQFFRPDIMIELFCTALALMFIMLSIMRPEERMDSETGMISWASYQYDIRNIILSGEHVQIIVIQLQNSREIRNYLGDHEYNKYISKVGDGLRNAHWKHQRRIEPYFERPGTIYMITDPVATENMDVVDRLLNEARESVKIYEETGVRFDPLVCIINCPEDAKKAEEIYSIGHTFSKIDNHKEIVYHANDIVHSPTFAVEAHIEEILDNAIKEGHIDMFYQPIYDVGSGKYHSAEALARISAPEYGVISPTVFIPAAETRGFMIPIGDIVLKQVFRFVAEHDLDALGLSYIELNLSVAQCMERSLPEKIRKLQKRYKVDPSRINLEITETSFENINEIMRENVNELINMGYSFSLDDYGTGYSNIQRVNNIPFKLIKIDKSMLDEVSTENGKKIFEYTVRMMQSIGKQLVSEGAETKAEVEMLKEMGVDYIQGFYYSHPMPSNRFVQFLSERNNR